ncbi:MAG: MHJ_0274 family protein [Metamycoplasmataceae bacterium]
MDNWIVWLIMGLLIALLVGFMVFSFLKDKKRNKEIFKKKLELKRVTEKNTKVISVKVTMIIEKNKQELESFISSIGNKKMKDINNASRDLLKNIRNSKEFKLIYIKGESNPLMVSNLDALINVKSNLWEKKCKENIVFFSLLNEELKNDPFYETIVQEEKEKIDNRFNSNYIPEEIEQIEEEVIEDNNKKGKRFKK